MNTNWFKVQARLKELGHYKTKVDGIRGPYTDAALVAFKKSVGFRARPYLGPLTLAALFPPTSEVPFGQPVWFEEASRLRGLHEVRNVSSLRKALGASFARYDPRSVPWCGAFIQACIEGSATDEEMLVNPLGARNWNKFGKPTTPRLGAIMVFWRGSKSGWKGHVGFYYGEDRTHYHILGGNQSNAVTVSRISKTRLLGARWLLNEPITTKPVFLSSSGVPVTTNEA
jgi:uncharacterized protein (TIGR02594 family)